MIETVHAIIENRDCGHLRVGYVRVYPSDTIGQIASRLGLKNDNGVYLEVNQKMGLSILKRILSQDMAYGTRLKVDDTSIMAMVDGYESAVWYSNTVQAEYDVVNDNAKSWSWNPATESTFDMGVIVRSGNVALCIWAEDED